MLDACFGAEYVPLDCLSRRDHPAGTIRDRARPLPCGAEPAGARIDRRDQRRRLRDGLVRPSQRARALPRGPAGVVGREFALSLPPYPLASLFCPCARLARQPRPAPAMTFL